VTAPVLGLRVWQLGVLGTALLVGVAAGINPTLGIAAAMGLAFVLVVVSDLAIGVAVFAVLAYLDVLNVSGSLLSFAKVVGLLLALAWLAVVAVRGGERRNLVVVHPGFVAAIVLLLAWGLTSTLWAERPASAVGSIGRLALTAFLPLIVFAAVRERRHASLLAAALVVGATIAAVSGIFTPPDAGSSDRLAGTIGDANELAAVLVVGLVLSFTLSAMARHAPAWRLAALVAGLLCGFSIFLTLSRGGLVALGAALLTAIVFGGRWRGLAVAVALAIAFTTVGYFATVASPAARARVTTAKGGAGRSDLWKVGFRMVQAHPVRGVGAGNFRVSSVHYLLQPGAIRRTDFIVDRPLVAHNTFLQVLAELGVVGLALFVTIVSFAVRCLVRAARAFAGQGDVRMELLARGTLIALVGLLAAYVFISEEYSKQLWLLLGLAPALLALARRSDAPSPRA